MHANVLHTGMASEIDHQDGTAQLRRRLIRQADACVACGMCLPVCPTYNDTREESESARGRISLIRGLAEDRLTPTSELVGHLDRCLQCQACEAICPAGVRYGELIDGAQELLLESTSATASVGVADRIAWFVRTPKRLRLLGGLLAAYRATGLRWLARHSGLIRALGLQSAERFSDVDAGRFGWRASYPPQGTERGRLALFTGCIANLVDRDNLSATIRVLTALGYRVEVPPTQRCCGALDLHAGRHAEFAAAAARNLNAFSALDTDTVVYIASGCGAVLSQYQSIGNREKRVNFVDVNRFILDHSDAQAFTPCDAGEGDVFLHIPCSMKNATREQDAPKQLLDRIGVNFVSSDNSAQCCGAAGTYSMRHPDLAGRLGREVLRQAEANGCTAVATCNVGCAMHLQAIAKEDAIDMPVTHPVRMVERRLARQSADD